uniref:Uncharacterized protein n=1 Tax=Arundo donax TaxID=35708 RepID=A0A0A8Y794_ARUDO
MRQSYKGQK